MTIDEAEQTVHMIVKPYPVETKTQNPEYRNVVTVSTVEMELLTVEQVKWLLQQLRNTYEPKGNND